MSDRTRVESDGRRGGETEGKRIVKRENDVPEVMRHEWEERVEPVWRRLPLMADWIEHYGV
jgi:hypothetical protein